MINSNLKEKYWDSGTDKQMVISVVGTNQKIDNSMLEVGTFALEEGLCSESELKFGACEANSVKFTARNTAGSINGRTISISETVDGDSENPMPYGIFKVASDVPTADRTKRQITAYDAMYDIINADVKAWYAGLSFPITLKAFRDSFFAYLGIEQAVATLPNDSMTVNKTLVATQTDDSSVVTEESAISGKTVVTAICEINGCFGNINRNGKFEYVFLKEITSALYPAEDLFPADNVFPSDANTESMTGHYITFDYEDFQSKAITQLEIRADDNTAGAIVGKTGNNYVISCNFLVSDKTGAELTQIANNLLPIMKQAAYTPIKSCTTVGNPCLELGDPIRFNTSREIVETYLLQRTLTGVQSKRDSIAAQGTPTHTKKTNSIRETLESVQRRTSKLEHNADHLLSQYEDLEEQTNTKFEQTANAITAEATRAQGAEGNLSSQISIVAGEVSSKVSRGDVVSEINQTADTISLRAGHLEIDCNNFQVDKDTGDAKIGGALSFYEDFSESHSGEIQYGKLPGGGSMGFNMNDSLNVSGNIYMNQSLVATTSDITVTWFSGDSTPGVYNSIHMSGTVIDGSKISYDDLKTKLSDKRLKEDISVLAGAEIEDFYMNLIPTKHRYKYGAGVGEDDKYQFGVIAQWTEKDMIDHNINPDVYNVVRKSKPIADTDEAQYTGGDDVYRVDYDQFHALHIYMIQMQQKEIMNLKLENVALEGELDIFNRRLKEVEAKLC